MIRSTRAVSAALAASALALLLSASSARAQESQPFTNTGDEGVRVVPADGEEATGLPLAIRADGDYGTGAIPVGAQNPSSPATNAGTLSALQMRGRLAASYDATPNITAFASLFSSYTQFAGSKLSSLQSRNLVSRYTQQNPYHNWGDLTVGGRWTTRASDDLYWGAEGGMVIPGGANGLGAGPAFDATTPFARMLLSWTHDAVRVHGNLGLAFDQSWNLWKDAFNDPKNSDLQSGTGGPNTRTVTDIDPEERAMLGIYGKNGPIARVLGGAAVSYQFGAVRPFFETSVELTGGATALHLTPGIVIAPERVAHFLLAADLTPVSPGRTDPAPPVPVLGLHAALAFDFGGRATRASSGGLSHPRPGLQVQVTTDANDPVEGARVTLQNQSPNDPLRRTEQPIGEIASDEHGMIDIPRSALSRDLKVVGVRADHDGYLGLPARVSGQRVHVVLVPRTSTARVELEFRDDHGQDLPPNAVRVMLVWGRTHQSFPRSIPPSPGNLYAENVPATAGQDWRIMVQHVGEGAPANIPVPPGGLSKKLFWDPEGDHWTDAPTHPPEPPVDLVGVFDMDEATVKPIAALGHLADRLNKEPNTKVQMLVVMHEGGDPAFALTLANARAEALVGWLKAHGVKEPQILRPNVSLHGQSELVRMEVK